MLFRVDGEREYWIEYWDGLLGGSPPGMRICLLTRTHPRILDASCTMHDA